MEKLPQLTNEQLFIILHALYVAAGVYDADVHVEGMTEPMKAQFRRQAKQARDLRDFIENQTISV